jgi:hypothetical protein
MADVSAYDDRPSSSSCGSNVPMQPRSEVSWRGEMVFQVTKSGCSSAGSDDIEVLGVSAPDAGDEREKVLEVEGEEVPLEEEEEDEAVARRWRAGRRFASFPVLSPVSPPASADLTYWAHDCWTSARVRDLRFSRFEARASKQ